MPSWTLWLVRLKLELQVKVTATGIFWLHLWDNYCKNGQKIAKSFTAFTLQEVLDLTVKCIGLKKGLRLLALVSYFSEGCWDDYWRRAERVLLSSGCIHKKCKNYSPSGLLVFLGLIKATWVRRARRRRRQNSKLSIYKSKL